MLIAAVWQSDATSPETLLGTHCLQMKLTTMVLVNAFLFMPKDPHNTSPVLQVWLQEFCWCETGVLSTVRVVLPPHCWVLVWWRPATCAYCPALLVGWFLRRGHMIARKLPMW